MTEPRERRDNPTSDIEFRSTDAGITFSGYAAMFNVESEPIGGKFIETIAPGAFARSLGQSRDIKMLVDHNPERLLASTRAGTLRLVEDGIGLRVEADLAPTSYARDLQVLGQRGEVRSMSFTFRPTKGGDTWSADGSTRTLKDVVLYEVSALTGLPPAYPQTTAYLRSLAKSLDTDSDTLTEAIEAMTEGRELTEEQVRLLDAAIRGLAPKPEEPTLVGVPVSVQRARLALIAKKPR